VVLDVGGGTGVHAAWLAGRGYRVHLVDVVPGHVRAVAAQAADGDLNGAPFTGSTMLVAGGGMCVGVSKAALTAANVAVGDEVQLSITSASS
jgi:hypothetical protein